MKTTRAVLLLLAFGAILAPAYAKTILPDACGDPATTFEVKTQKDQPPPAAPGPDRGQIIFIGTLPHKISLSNPVSRVGVDGKWVGANKGNSYFVLNLAPGEHHICVNWEGKKEVGVLALTVEAGKVYYYEAAFTAERHGGGGMVTGGGGYTASGAPAPPAQVVGGGSVSQFFSCGLLSEDEGKFRVKASELSVSNPKK